MRMLDLSEATTVYLACGATDMRKSINGLTTLVHHSFKADLFSQSLFVFCNRKQDKLKILTWDHNGFWLYYRRLERGQFRWPKHPSSPTITITRRELGWLLDGLSLEQPDVHLPVTARIVG